jgi:hypothetical protein
MSDDEKKQLEDKKRAAIRRFCELDRQGLVEHDWSETAKTGMVKVRYKVDDVDGLPLWYRAHDPAGGNAATVQWDLTPKGIDALKLITAEKPARLNS